MIKIKICGITNLEDAVSAIELGADALGFVFAPSPRQVTPQQAKEIIEKLPPFVATVGVFTDESPERVRHIADECKLDYIQLHGENPIKVFRKDVLCYRKLKVSDNINKKGFLREKRLFPLSLWCFLRRKGETALAQCGGNRGFPPLTMLSAILIDTKEQDWELAIDAKKYGKPVILAGGLTPDNVKEAIEKVKPYGVDVSSGVESSPGKKDCQKMKRFIDAAR